MTVHSKFVVVGIVLVAAIAYLAAAGVKSGWVYYIDVDRFLTDAQYRTQRVRLHGKVQTEGFDCRAGSLTASFNLTGQTKTLAITYRGVIPDQFQAGREVVVEGKLDGAGVFQADVLLTKCASKYEKAS